ncbi:penicillin-binding transpeptidase domain-containing protein [Nocardiopsis lambiniae]|uniref:Penicillin-binding transpeptidase domain-containing protein n=1 Tax=Nocardiopsis lambiniae TaxID=3075539 RepID=A0ABU2MF44_9ACTN|nr:penicillin-binding transpeptidase domain-containing protein [Nocardiopsis sp. DSM 44743]MDT0331322.1 penicillin-binding transpeptidase domain-containing protein [Nocardiopsis sp. DSM 44743]
MSPRPSGRKITAAGSALLLATTLAACTPDPSPEVAVRSFLLAWQDGDHATAARYTDGDPEEVERSLVEMREQLDLASLRFGLGPISRDDKENATAEFSAHADLGIGDPTWDYTGRMPLAWGPDGWRITWSPSVLHPDLSDDERLAVSYETQERGQILDRSGQPLVTADRVTAFGVIPADMEDRETGVTELAELLDEDPAPLLNRVRSAPPEQFQPLVLMRDSSVNQGLLSDIRRIPGADVQEVEINLTPQVAPFLLGEVAGTAEHRVSSRVPGPYQAGDTVGLSGLQNIFQHELAGSATTQVVTLDADGEITGVLEAWEGDRSGVIETTLDVGVQRAAENALTGMPGNGYLVAVDTTNGEILAAANASDDTADDGALTGSYKPGGTFGMVAALAALESGAATPTSEVPCVPSVEIGGQTFTNPSGGSLSFDPNLVRNIAFSCNVGFAGLGEEVGADALAESALRLGIGQDWQLAVPASAGEIEIGDDEVELASAMIGEHGVRVSPLSMALAAATVADGTPHAPLLVRGDTPSAGEGGAPSEADLQIIRQGLREAVVQRMPELTIGVGEGEVYGQAVRTEQGETALHWFVGYQGNVAFAVLAEVEPAQTMMAQYGVMAAQSFLSGMAQGLPEAPADAPLEEADLNAVEETGW